MPEQIVNVALSTIDTIPELEDRPLNQKHVEALVATNEPDTWPPIIVTTLGNRYGRIAGKHRIEAARQLKRANIRAVIRSYGSKAEMYAAMWDDNIKNGLTLTAKERKQYAINLHKLHPGMSSREIARRTGLTHPTVQAAIKEDSPDDKEKKQQDIVREFKGVVRKLATASTDFCMLTHDMGVTQSAEALYNVILAGSYDVDDLDDFEIFFEDMSQVLSVAAKKIAKLNQKTKKAAS